MKKSSAFTLIELLIVIAILSLLVSLAVPKLVSRKEEGKRMKAIIQIQLFMQALEKYRLEKGNYPSTSQGLITLITKERYLDKKRLPLDPWKSSYIYLSPGDNQHPYIIISLGRDKENGGNSWDKDIKSYEIEETL